MNNMFTAKRILIIGIVAIVVSLIVFNAQALSGTRINISLSDGSLEEGLVANWTFDGADMTSNVGDVGPNNYDGLLTNQTPTTTVQGVLGQALEFDGVDDYVSVDTGGTDLVTAFEPYTVGFWMYVNSYQTSFPSLFQLESSGTYPLAAIINTDSSLYRPLSFGSRTGGDWLRARPSEDFSADLVGKWNHVTIVYDGGSGLSSLTFYLNGVEKTLTTADEFGVTANTTYLGLTSTYLDGKLDDFRIYNRVLSYPEIQRLYGLGATTHINTTIDANPDLESGLVGHWTFDGKDMISNIADRSGNGNDGYLTNQTPTTTSIGVLGQALEFDGVDDYVNIPDDDTLSPTNITVMTWVYDPSFCTTNCQDTLISKDYNEWELNILNSGGCVKKVAAYVGGASNSACGNTTVTAGEWHYIGFTYDGSTITVYLDGEPDGTKANTAGISNQSDAVFIGARSPFIFPADAFFDDTRIYNRVLSYPEIQRLYGLGATTHINTTIDANPDLESGLVGHWTFDGKDMISNIADRSGNGNDGYLTNQTPTTTSIGVLGQALEFDGVDDYVSVDTGGTDLVTASEPYTVGFWMYVNSYQTSFPSLFQLESSGTYPLAAIINTDSSLYRPLSFGSRTGGDWLRARPSEDFSADLVGKWNHATIVYDGGSGLSSLTFYLNGVEKTLTTADEFGVTANTTYLGLTSTYLDGKLDDFRIYNRALSTEEIKRLYELGG